MSDHYWTCPYFPHYSFCPYLNVLNGSNCWPPVVPNPQMAQTIQGSNPNIKSNCGQKPRKSQDNVEKSSAKNCNNGFKIERLYSCRLCNDLNEVKDEGIVRKHIEDHLGKVRPFVCQICGKEFKFRSNCRNHIIAHSVVRKHVHRIDDSTYGLDEQN